MKQITIDNKQYNIDCNALTYLKYKSFFKTGIIQDLQVIENYLIKQTVIAKKLEEEKIPEVEQVSRISKYMSGDIDEFIIKITQIAWILIYTADRKVEEYEKWLQNINKFKIDDDWIAEVAEFAVDCFC